MEIFKYISNITSIKEEYIILMFKTIIIFIILNIIKLIGLRIIKGNNNKKKEYLYTKKFKMFIVITKILFTIFIWIQYFSNFITLISIVSAAFTIALRDLIFNFFSGIYIKLKKPFCIEDRVEIDDFKGDVVNISALSFELLEVNNEDFTGQSTGVVIHVPCSKIFSSPLRNYNKGFKYIWNELTVKVPIEHDMEKTKKVIYKIVNSNDILESIPKKTENQINNISNEYRIYYNSYTPVIYTKVVDDHVEYTLRYLVHPKKARYVNSSLWKYILKAHKKGEIELFIS